MHNKTALSAARLLLRKGFSFCLYRFPGESQFNVATEENILPHKPSTGFVVAPFESTSLAHEVHLHKIEVLADYWQKDVESMPDQPIMWGALPLETTKEQYLTRIGHFLKDMRNGVLDKAILSRVMLLNKPEGFDSFAFFERLCNDYTGAFVSVFYKPQTGIWIGATPETLLAKTDNVFLTMALAGTQPRKAGEYSWRPKELEEHEMVGQHIEHVFKRRGCECLEKKGPFTVEAGKVAHLRTDYIFSENGKQNVSEIVADLHPTPAIGGLPVDKGVECILKYEGYDRKYYCGYIGEMNSEYAKLYINLRCMQEGRDQLAVFAGGGITARSNEEEEWNETVQKSLTMLEKI